MTKEKPMTDLSKEALDDLVLRLTKLGRDMYNHAAEDWDEHEDVQYAADAITALREKLAMYEGIPGHPISANGAVDEMADKIAALQREINSQESRHERDLAVARAVLEAARKAVQATTKARCEKCGYPRDNHPYRHIFVSSEILNPSDAIRALDPAQIVEDMEETK